MESGFDFKRGKIYVHYTYTLKHKHMLGSCNHIKKFKKKKMLGSCKGFFFFFFFSSKNSIYE